MLTGGTGAGAAAADEVGIEFTAANVDRFTSVEAMQPPARRSCGWPGGTGTCCWVADRYAVSNPASRGLRRRASMEAWRTG